MDIYAPQTLMTRAEAQILMTMTHNLAAHKAAEPLTMPLQDITASMYLFTLKCVFLGTQMVQLMGVMNDCAMQGKNELPLPVVYVCMYVS